MLFRRFQSKSALSRSNDFSPLFRLKMLEIYLICFQSLCGARVCFRRNYRFSWKRWIILSFFVPDVSTCNNYTHPTRSIRTEVPTFPGHLHVLWRRSCGIKWSPSGDTGRCFKNFPTLPVYHYELREGATKWLTLKENENDVKREASATVQRWLIRRLYQCVTCANSLQIN